MNVAPYIITERTIVDAWRQCTSNLLSSGDRFNLLVHISDPTVVDYDLIQQYDPKRVNSSTMSVFDVANTIFPRQGVKWNLGVDGFSNYYIRVYERLKRRSSPTWGFYFQRIACFGPVRINQLARVINGLDNWGRNHHAAFVLHVSSSELDKPRPQGGPCLQYAQFMANGEKIELTVVYRSHDYFSKALGNFLGLSRLLTYVCRKTSHEVGSLSCLSTYAFLGPNRTKAKQLLSIK